MLYQRTIHIQSYGVDQSEGRLRSPTARLLTGLGAPGRGQVAVVIATEILSLGMRNRLRLVDTEPTEPTYTSIWRWSVAFGELRSRELTRLPSQRCWKVGDVRGSLRDREAVNNEVGGVRGGGRRCASSNPGLKGAWFSPQKFHQT